MKFYFEKFNLAILSLLKVERIFPREVKPVALIELLLIIYFKIENSIFYL